MKYQLISMKLGKGANAILKKYPKVENMHHSIENEELFINIDYIKDVTDTIKQNVIVCHDENVIHIYDQKLR